MRIRHQMHGTFKPVFTDYVTMSCCHRLLIVFVVLFLRISSQYFNLPSTFFQYSDHLLAERDKLRYP